MAVWIEDYRRQYGLEADDLARMVNVVGRKMTPKLEGTVSDTLIYILETSKKPRTHPRIADAIATVCHATLEQRDSIVDERHRGKWKSEHAETAKSEPQTPAWKLHGEKPVVMIDGSGNMLTKYSSTAEASRASGIATKTIGEICKRKRKDVLARYKITFRYVEEWNAMTDEQRIQDIDSD